VVEGSGFENRRIARYRGFESLLLRCVWRENRQTGLNTGRGDRVAEGTRLLSERRSKAYRGFESLPLRKIVCGGSFGHPELMPLPCSHHAGHQAARRRPRNRFRRRTCAPVKRDSDGRRPDEGVPNPIHQGSLDGGLQHADASPRLPRCGLHPENASAPILSSLAGSRS
jgi:hypothetical protein